MLDGRVSGNEWTNFDCPFYQDSFWWACCSFQYYVYRIFFRIYILLSCPSFFLLFSLAVMSHVFSSLYPRMSLILYGCDEFSFSFWLVVTRPCLNVCPYLMSRRIHFGIKYALLIISNINFHCHKILY